MTELKRIWENNAYGHAPVKACWWAETTEKGDWPSLTTERNTEVAIIGAGFTGLSAALHLAEQGVDVTVLEAEHPFFGASGRNGGFCCLGGAKASYSSMARTFGPAEARAFCQAERAAVDTVDALLTRLSLDVDRHSKGETLLAHRPSDFVEMQNSVEETRALYGVETELVPQEALAQAGMNGPFYGAATIPIGFALNPRKYALGLAEAAKAAGAVIHGQSAVQSIETAQDGRHVLRTKSGSVKAKNFILATNGYSSENLPKWMAGRYMPTQSSVLVTRPMTNEELNAQGWTSTQMCYDTRNLLHYFRLMPDRRMLFGMRGGMSHKAKIEAHIRKSIRADFEAMFPAWSNVETPHYWSGFVCLSRDFLPYVGPIPGIKGAFAGFAYHGNGVAMASYSGRLLADLVRGETPDTPFPAPMRHTPRQFPLGLYRRLLMKPAYLKYAWDDR